MSVVDSGDVERVDLAAFSPEPKAFRRIPRAVAFRHAVLCLYCDANELTVALSDVRDNEAIETVRFVTGMHVRAVRADAGDILRALQDAYGGFP